MLDTANDIVRSLVRYPEMYDPKSGSIITLSNSRPSPYADPFKEGFIAQIEDRAELIRRLARLRARERLTLLLWYCAQWKPGRIARFLDISRQHCYRVRDSALDRLVAMAEAEQEVRAV